MVRCKECPIVLSSVDLLSHSGNQFPWSVGCFKSKVDLDFKAVADHLLRQNCCFFPPSTNIHNQCFMHDPAVEWILLWLDLPPQRWLSRHKASFSMSLSYPLKKNPLTTLNHLSINMPHIQGLPCAWNFPTVWFQLTQRSCNIPHSCWWAD